MLSLKSPPLQVGSMVLYPDHADSFTYYYSAGPPRIALYDNKNLMYALFIYRDILKHSAFTGTTIPDEMGAGFLTLGVDCRRDPDELKTAAKEISAQMNVDEDKIKLAPIPYKDGMVALIGLDLPEGDDAPPPPAVTDKRPQFVRNLMGSARPSLLGDLRSIFSISLNDRGAAFMAGVHDTGALPFGVSYDLTFEGLQPSVDAIVTAETSQLRTYFGGGIQGQYQFLKADVAAGIEKMNKDGRVKIELISQQTGQAAEDAKKMALDLFKERIIQDLFNPGLPAVPPVAATATASTAALAGAANALAQTATNSITLSLKAEEQTTTGHLIYNFSESAPTERRDSPNAFLQALMDKERLKKSIVFVDLATSMDFFNNLEIIVSGPGPDVYAALKISRITVEVSYGEPGDATPPETEPLVFTPNAALRDLPLAFRTAKRKSLSYSYVIRYDFLADENISADALRYDIPSRRKTARTLSVNPQDDFQFTKFTVRTGHIDAAVTSVDVALSAEPDATGFAPQKRIRFDMPFSDAGSGWSIRRLDKTPLTLKVATSFSFANDEVYAPTSRVYSGSLLTVDDPFNARRDLLVIPNIVSEHVDAIDVEVMYEDKIAHYARHFLLTLRPPFEPQSMAWPIIDSSARSIHYRTTVHESGVSQASELTLADEPSITVGGSAVLMDRITVRLIGGTLAAESIDAVVVDVQSKDADGRNKSDSLFFADGQEMVQTLPLIHRPGDPPTFSYRLQTFKTDGTQSTSGWTEKAGNPLLIVSIRNL